MATVQLTLEEHEARTRLTAKLLTENEQLQARLDALPPAPSDALLFFEALRIALPIAQFAIANLQPTDVRGWPYQNVRDLARALRDPAIGKVTNGATDLARGFEKFAEEAEFWEKERAKGTEKETFREMVAARSVTPGRVAEIFQGQARLAPAAVLLPPITALSTVGEPVPITDQPVAAIETNTGESPPASAPVDNLATAE